MAEEPLDATASSTRRVRETASKNSTGYVGRYFPSVTVWPFLSAILLLILWQGLSILIGAEVLPGPVNSMQAIAEAHRSGYLWSDMAITISRVLGAFVLSLIFSIAVGTTLGSSRVAERLFGPWVTIFASIPALLFIVIVYLAVGLNDFGAILGACFVVFPLMTFGVWDGMRSLDPELQEMANAFGIKKSVTLRRVLVPQTLPFIFTVARSGLAFTWRIMIFVELLGCSSGVGYRIQYWYSLFDMKNVLASALPFIAFMLALEYGVLRPLEKWVFRWRKDSSL